MKNNLVIAAAGSGKTTFLVREALKQTTGSVLITTYTQANETEIRKKFVETHGCIPAHVTVQTWFSTLLQHGARPYQAVLLDETVRGMVLVNEPSAIKYISKTRKKVYYGENDDLKKHYFTHDFKLYSDKIAKFVLRCNQKTNGAVIERLSRIFSHIFVDEVQDLAGYDLELVKLFLKSPSEVLLVGDPRQVTYLTHNERKYSKYKDGKIKEFIQMECTTVPCQIDEETLNQSYRNNKEICEYSSQLYPNFTSCVSNQRESTGHDGVFFVREEDVQPYLEKYVPVQLKDSSKTKVNAKYKSINFGESKGLTFDRVLIYPTRPFKEWMEDHNYELAPMSRAKFYVAITRAKFSVGIVYNPSGKVNTESLQRYCVQWKR